MQPSYSLHDFDGFFLGPCKSFDLVPVHRHQIWALNQQQVTMEKNLPGNQFANPNPSTTPLSQVLRLCAQSTEDGLVTVIVP